MLDFIIFWGCIILGWLVIGYVGARIFGEMAYKFGPHGGDDNG